MKTRVETGEHDWQREREAYGNIRWKHSRQDLLGHRREGREKKGTAEGTRNITDVTDTPKAWVTGQGVSLLEVMVPTHLPLHTRLPRL